MISAMDKNELGLTGIQVSPLCFGTGTGGWNHRSKQGDLGVERLSHLLRFAHERGITFWDTADEYGTHPHVAAALREIERETVTLTTKTVSRDARGIRQDVDRFLREMDTDYLDIVLCHCLTSSRWPDEIPDAMEALSSCKAQGKVRAVGLSCHAFGALQTAARTDWVDVVLARINHAGHSMDDTPEKVVPVIEALVAAGKGVYGMKVLGAGTSLTEDPARAIRYSLGLSGIHAIVIGMMDEAEIEENLGLVNQLVAA